MKILKLLLIKLKNKIIIPEFLLKNFNKANWKCQMAILHWYEVVSTVLHAPICCDNMSGVKISQNGIFIIDLDNFAGNRTLTKLKCLFENSKQLQW